MCVTFIFIFGAVINGLLAAPSTTNSVTTVNITQHPYFVHVSSRCAGAILSDKWVITATACINNTQGHIYVGKDEKYEYDYVAIHGRPYFDLLHLKTPLNFSDEVQPISLSARFGDGWAHLITKETTEDYLSSNDSEECECEYYSDESYSSFESYEDRSLYFFGLDLKKEECICEPNHTLIKSDVYAFTIYYCRRNCDTQNGKRFCGMREQKQHISCDTDLGSPLVRGSTLVGIVTGTDEAKDCRKSKNLHFVNIAEYHYYISYMIGPEGSY